MISLDKNLAWGRLFGDSPISHGDPAESFFIHATDTVQLAALWGAVPGFACNCVIPRSGSMYIPVVVPPFADQAVPVVAAAGDGTIEINQGGSAGTTSTITISGDASNITAEFAAVTVGPLFDLDASTTDWIKVSCSANVRVFGIAFRFDREDPSLASAV